MTITLSHVTTPAAEALHTQIGEGTDLGTLPPTLSARIALEIYEDIIDYMEQCALPRAALVCWVWYPRAMHNLYSTVEVNTRTSFDMLLKQARTSTRVKQWLATTRTLIAANGFLDYDQCTTGRMDGRFLHALPLAFGRTMSGIHTLQMGGSLFPAMLATFVMAWSQFTSLRTLRLSDLELNSVTQLRWIACAFSELKELALYGSGLALRQSASNAQHVMFQPGSRVPKLHRLEIDTYSYDVSRWETIIDWLAYSGICTSLGELTVHLTNEPGRNLDPLDRLLAAAEASLSQYYEFVNDDALSILAGFFPARRQRRNLTSNTSLRTLHFMLHAIDEGQPLHKWPLAVDEIRGVLATVRSQELEDVTIWSSFNLYGNAFDELRLIRGQLDLRGLHGVMDQPYFDQLTRVKVMMMVNHDARKRSKTEADDIARELALFLQNVLGPWNARGFLHEWRSTPYITNNDCFDSTGRNR